MLHSITNLKNDKKKFHFIMVKRKKWKSKEDQMLKIIIKNMKEPLKWDVISHLLKK